MGNNERFFVKKTKKKNTYTWFEMLIAVSIILILLPMIAIPIFVVILYFVSPPVNYKDYQVEQQKRIEHVQEKDQQSW